MAERTDSNAILSATVVGMLVVAEKMWANANSCAFFQIRLRALLNELE